MPFYQYIHYSSELQVHIWTSAVNGIMAINKRRPQDRVSETKRNGYGGAGQSELDVHIWFKI